MDAMAVVFQTLRRRGSKGERAALEACKVSTSHKQKQIYHDLELRISKAISQVCFLKGFVVCLSPKDRVLVVMSRRSL